MKKKLKLKKKLRRLSKETKKEQLRIIAFNETLVVFTWYVCLICDRALRVSNSAGAEVLLKESTLSS